MTKTEMRKIAKEILVTRIGSACYSLENDEYKDLSQDEVEIICQYIFQYGKSMAKAIGEIYHTL